MNRNPPLPDWLDVEAGEIKDEHLRDAGRAIAGYWPDIWRNRKYVETYGTFVPVGFPVDSITPYACIARWAGENYKRWSSIMMQLTFRLTDIGPDDEMPDSPDFIMKRPPNGCNRSSVLCAYQIITATDTQLYRTLVNVAWDEWRAEYNKRREAEEVRDESE